MNMLRDMLQPTRRNMLRSMFTSTTSTTALTRFAVNGVEAALALDFIGSEYRTANTSTTFADAFTGTSPKLTYSTAAGSNSTMVNSSGNIVWAPHNLALNSATPATQTIAVRSGAQYTVRVTGTGSMALSGAGAGTATDGSPATITASTTSLTITLTGSLDTVAVYRSDLGGMAQVPQSATGFEYYVPTNGSAEFLPRVGHHVYNGSAWVNEGLLIESEPRTNLVTYSEDFTDTAWQKTRSTAALNAVGPDGLSNSAATFTVDTVGGVNTAYLGEDFTVSTSTSYTFSIFARADQTSDIHVRIVQFTTPAEGGIYFDLSAGTVGTANAGLTGEIEDFGNGWHRCSVTFTTDATDTTGIIRVFLADGESLFVTRDGTSSVLVYGAQLEEAPTPSSYMPTYGNQFTRTAQSLEVPPVEFGWPTPEYIGPELVVDGSGNWVGDFDVAADLDGWTITDATRGTAVASGGRAVLTNDYSLGSTSGFTGIVAPLTTVAGRVYEYKANLAGIAGVSVSNNSNGAAAFRGATGTGDTTVYFVASAATTYVVLYVATGSDAATANFDNISVREINPLSVSIQMDGRMTYADDGASNSLSWWLWNGTDDIWAYYATDGAYDRTKFQQASDVAQNASGSQTEYLFSPGNLVPFNIAGRFGSTFVNGAVDGVALTADTTPTALPDLSGTNLQIASDFMGTIGTFRQFAGDIGDTGLVTATEPSTEPTLSLTFDGTEGSFYNLSWSE